jgi:uncharacterized protein (DUF1697 family)
MPVTAWIALLRGINVSGKNQITMPELRAVCADLGWQDVQSYIQSGNLVFRAEESASALELQLEAAITERFGLRIPVIVRAAAAWPAYVAGNPFPDASRDEPNRVMLTLSKAPPRADALAALHERAVGGEQLAQIGDGIWVYYPAGAGATRLSPALFDRLVGSPVTARNWRTVLTLANLCGA